MTSLNVIVKGAKTLKEYKLERAAIAKMAENFAAQFAHGDPETAWIDQGVVFVVYKDGSRWKYTPDDEAIPLE